MGDPVVPACHLFKGKRDSCLTVGEDTQKVHLYYD